MDRQELLKFIEDAELRWRSPDGLMRLDLLDARPNPPHVDTVKNENGIYFLAHYLLLCKKLGALPASVMKMPDLLKALEQKPGLLNRHPGNSTRHEAQDNYVGALLCEAVIGRSDLAKRVCSYGLRHLYNYNNVPPHEWLVRQQRQGGEVAFYQIMAGKWIVNPLFLIWLIAGLLINALGGKPSDRHHVSDALLAYARLEALKLALKRRIWGPVRLALAPIFWLWKRRTVKKYGSIKALYQDYYGTDRHPIGVLAGLIDWRKE